ncbi:MAG: hypothetical protein P8016_13525 [Sedimentisphaerales bacterium]
MYHKTTTTRRRLTDLLEPEFMARLDSLDVMSRKILQGKLHGERRTKRRGQSVEFADHRPYVAGDDLRFVDWNIYALGYVSLVNNNRVTISFFADGIEGQLANMRGRTYLHKMADYLLSAECDGFSHFEKACRQLTSGRIGSGITIVLSDFLFKEGYDEGLRRLIGKQYDLYVIQVLSPQELTPDVTGELKLIDIEDADIAEITVSGALLKYYKKTLSAYCNELKDFCTRRGAVYVLANSSDSIEHLVLNYLRRIRLLR